MKRIVVAAMLAGLGSVACAQGYAGAVLSLSRLDFGCVDGNTCDEKGRGFKIYAGSKLSPGRTLNLGIGKLDAIEVSYLKFGKAKASGSKEIMFYEDSFVFPFPVDTTETALADALTLAAVVHVPVVDQLTAVGRLGVAYVSSTLRSTVDGKTMGATTSNKFKPYAGLGLEYGIPNVVKVVGSFDWTKYEVNDRKGNAKMFGLGVETNF
jgi:hypothetical protein